MQHAHVLLMYVCSISSIYVT